MANWFLRSLVVAFSMGLSLQASCVLSEEARKEQEDAFSWQVEQRFKDEVTRFTALAETEFLWLVDATIEKIDQEKDFFIQRRESLLKKLRDTIYNWLFEKVLVEPELFIPSDVDDESSEDEYGYFSSPYATERESESDEYLTEDSEYLELVHEQLLKEWQRWELFRELGILVDFIDNFTEDMIDIAAIKKFLETRVQGGYSSLLNEIVVGSCRTTDDFTSMLYDKAFAKSMQVLLQSLKRKTFITTNTRLIEGIKDALSYLLNNKMFKTGCFFDDETLKKLGLTQQTTTDMLTTKELNTFLRYVVNLDDIYMISLACEGTEVESFVWQQVGMPKELLENILDGLWFDYDWEQLDLADPLFVAQTYKRTLVALRNGACAQDVKEHIVSSLRRLFVYKEDDFEGVLATIRDTYNDCVTRNDWLGAFIEWSIYCAYRREFASLVQLNKVLVATNGESLLPQLVKANKERSLVKETTEARTRALKSYTKVYLHEETDRLVFNNEQGRQGRLALAPRLSFLKQVGMSYEKCRPKGSHQNIFVPELYLIVQKADGSEAPQFIEMPLLVEQLGLPRRPATRHVDDRVFLGDRADIEEGYFVLPKQDYIRGRMIQGVSEQEALNEIEAILSRGTRSQLLVHSERVIVELLRRKDLLKILVETTVEQWDTGHGEYLVRGLTMLAYSTNSVCPCCTPTILALMNSHEEGFMVTLVQELQDYEGRVQFTVPEQNGLIDWTQVRCNVFVTAKKNFDTQAHDMTEQEQQFQERTAHLNTKAPLRRPNNEFIVSAMPYLATGTSDDKQRYFYEFVGKDRHVDEDAEELTSEYLKVVGSSGGAEIWKKVPAYEGT